MMLARAHLRAMPCHFPEGNPAEWCERHVKDAAMLRAIREEGLSGQARVARA